MRDRLLLRSKVLFRVSIIHTTTARSLSPGTKFSVARGVSAVSSTIGPGESGRDECGGDPWGTESDGDRMEEAVDRMEEA